MSAGTRSRYSILVDLDANQAINTINTLRTQLGGLGASFTQSNGAVTQSTMSFERYNTAAQKTIGTSSAMSSSLGQVRNSLGQLNSRINTTATLPIIRH